MDKPRRISLLNDLTEKTFKTVLNIIENSHNGGDMSDMARLRVILMEFQVESIETFSREARIVIKDV